MYDGLTDRPTPVSWKGTSGGGVGVGGSVGRGVGVGGSVGFGRGVGVGSVGVGCDVCVDCVGGVGWVVEEVEVVCDVGVFDEEEVEPVCDVGVFDEEEVGVV